MTPMRRWGTLTDASPAITAHRPVAVMRCNDANDWPVHSLILSVHDLQDLPLRRLPYIVPCSMIFGIVS